MVGTHRIPEKTWIASAGVPRTRSQESPLVPATRSCEPRYVRGRPAQRLALGKERLVGDLRYRGHRWLAREGTEKPVLVGRDRRLPKVEMIPAHRILLRNPRWPGRRRSPRRDRWFQLAAERALEQIRTDRTGSMRLANSRYSGTATRRSRSVIGRPRIFRKSLS